MSQLVCLIHSMPDWSVAFWHWITTGQNAVAVGMIVSSLLSAVSIFVLWKTLRAINRQAMAANKQAVAAEAQATAARKQAEVSEQMRVTSEDSAKASRLQSELVRHQTLSQLRPVLVFGKLELPNQESTLFIGCENVIENHGTGTALNISIQHLPPKGSKNYPVDEIAVELPVLGQNRRSRIYFDVAENKGRMQAKYDSEDGRHFVTTAEVGGSTYRNQKAFEITEHGGWIPDQPVPSDTE